MDLAERYPPKIEVNLDVMADMVSAVVDGGILLSKSLSQPKHLPEQIMLYRSRVVNRCGAGDLIVFGAPALAAWIAYLVVLFRLGRARALGAFATAFGVTCVSFWAGMVTALNLYGS